jgi:hypothetical protein
MSFPHVSPMLGSTTYSRPFSLFTQPWTVPFASGTVAAAILAPISTAVSPTTTTIADRTIRRFIAPPSPTDQALLQPTTLLA